MCIICVSEKGIKQPSEKTLKTMFTNNSDGAGFMYARDGKVHIEKGFMKWSDFYKAVKSHKFTRDDAVVYHFRISTQAGITQTMTQPFAVHFGAENGFNLEDTEKLKNECEVGVAHNGIIDITSDHFQKRFSDTALFVSEYLPVLLRDKSDLDNEYVMSIVEELTASKLAFLSGDGTVHYVGNFVKDKGIMYSNSTYEYVKYYPIYNKKYNFGNREYDREYDDGYSDFYDKLFEEIEERKKNNKAFAEEYKE